MTEANQNLTHKADKTNYVLLIVLIVFLVGAFPSWPHSENWGYGPAGLLFIVLIVYLVVLILNATGGL